jgi:hypothetical protein
VTPEINSGLHENGGPGPVLVSVYAPGAVGQAVLEATQGEAVLRGASVVVVNLSMAWAFCSAARPSTPNASYAAPRHAARPPPSPCRVNGSPASSAPVHVRSAFRLPGSVERHRWMTVLTTMTALTVMITDPIGYRHRSSRGSRHIPAGEMEPGAAVRR